MGWDVQKFGPVTVRLSGHGGERDERDHRMWDRFVAEGTELLIQLTTKLEYERLEFLQVEQADGTLLLFDEAVQLFGAVAGGSERNQE